MQKKLFLGKLLETQYIPDSFSSDEVGEWVSVSHSQYQIFQSVSIGDIVEDDTNYSCGEYGYQNRKWKILQEIIPVS